MARVNIRINKHCILCRYWQGSASAVPDSPKDYWEFDNNDRGYCLQRRMDMKAVAPGCQKYELNTYKYPLT